MVTRSHDRDPSAWWLLWHLVPGIGWLVLVVISGLLDAQPGSDRHGRPAVVPTGATR